MDLDRKLELLADDARFESCDSFTPRKRRGRAYSPGLQATQGPDGRPMTLFRLLQSNSCEWDCPYCPLRRSNDVERTTLEPDELATVFMQRHEAGEAQGLFLSSAVAGGVRPAMARMLDTLELLRVRYEYAGYIHLKLMPGARHDEVERAAQLADRVSINLEAPNGERMKRISPDRRWSSVLEPMAYAREQQDAGQLPSGQATQLVVGAAGEFGPRDLRCDGAHVRRVPAAACVLHGVQAAAGYADARSCRHADVAPAALAAGRLAAAPLRLPPRRAAV